MLEGLSIITDFQPLTCRKETIPFFPLIQNPNFL